MGCGCQEPKRDKLVNYQEKRLANEIINGNDINVEYYIVDDNIVDIVNKIETQDLLRIDRLDNTIWQLTFIIP